MIGFISGQDQPAKDSPANGWRVQLGMPTSTTALSTYTVFAREQSAGSVSITRPRAAAATPSAYRPLSRALCNLSSLDSPSQQRHSVRIATRARMDTVIPSDASKWRKDALDALNVRLHRHSAMAGYANDFEFPRQ